MRPLRYSIYVTLDSCCDHQVIRVIPYSANEPNEAMFALGFTNY